MELIPATAPADLLAALSSQVEANVVPILGILFFGVAVVFVIRWFNKSTRRLKA